MSEALRAPNWVVRLAARFDPAMQQLLPLLGKVRNATSEKAQRVLHWAPRSREDAVVATAESLLKLGIVSPPVRGRLARARPQPDAPPRP